MRLNEIKDLLTQYEAMKKEYRDIEDRIEKTKKELKQFNDMRVRDKVKGGIAGKQRFTIEGIPYREYKEKRTLLMSRELKLNSMKEKLEKKLIEVEDYIETIEDSRKRMILRYRYIDKLSWNEVAKKLGPGNCADSVRIELDRFLKK